jgi:glutamyl-tRNA synthetase
VWRTYIALTICPTDGRILFEKSPSGCLFDLIKLNDVSKNVISVMKADKVYQYIADWAEKYDEDFFKVFTADAAFSTALVNIDRESPKPRKDIAKWSEVKEYFSYMFDEYYEPCFELPENISKEDAKAILEKYLTVFDCADDKEAWFSKIKDMCEPLGFTPNVKEYKKNPDAFKGHVGDVSTVIRLAVTSRRNTPDLCSIMNLLGKDRVNNRINAVIESL